jgi:hypothetical protein
MFENVPQDHYVEMVLWKPFGVEALDTNVQAQHVARVTDRRLVEFNALDGPAAVAQVCQDVPTPAADIEHAAARNELADFVGPAAATPTHQTFEHGAESDVVLTVVPVIVVC